VLVPEFDGLAGLRAAPLPALAARLFLCTFSPGATTVQRRPLDSSTGVLGEIFRLGGVEYKVGIRAERVAFNNSFLQLAFECVLEWEFHRLAARLAGGADPRTDVILLRAGETLLSGADPQRAAHQLFAR